MAGFKLEDYELTQKLDDAFLQGPARPSTVRDLAQEWILIKLSRERDKMRSFGWNDEANAISKLETKIRRGEL